MPSTTQALLSKPQEAGTDSTTLFLSVYLVVLAFFLMLNSLSHPDKKKTEAVVTSVTETFEIGDSEPHLGIETDIESVESKHIQLGSYFAVLKRFMDMDVQLVSSEINPQGNVMQALFPVKAFFSANSANILPEKEAFMEDIAKNIGTQHPGMRVDVEIVFTGHKSLEVKRAGAVAQKLESLGVEARSISVGVVPGTKKNIRFTFYAHAS